MSKNIKKDNLKKVRVKRTNGRMGVHHAAKDELITDCEKVSEVYVLGLGECITTEAFVDSTLKEGLIALGQGDELFTKFSRICRCCLIECDDLNPLFDEQDSTISMMISLTQLQIVPDDGLPPNICEECFQLLKTAVNFRQQILNADLSLKHYVAVGYKEGNDLQILEFEELTKTRSCNTATNIGNVHIYDQIKNTPSKEENDQQIDHYFVQKIENRKSKIISSNIEVELKQEFEDDNVQYQESIKPEAIEQININMNTGEVHIKEKMKERIVVKENIILSKEKNIQRIDYSPVPKTETSESVVNNFKMKGKLKDKFNKPQNNVKQTEIVKTGIIKQINGNKETSDAAHIENEMETKKVDMEKSKNESLQDAKKKSKLGTAEKKHVCEHCSKGFSFRSNLAKHIRTHTGEKPHVCNKCDKRFSESCTLKVHMRLHSGGKPYVCDQCSKGFNHLEGLVVHLRTHTGEKPFSCEQCNRRFNHRKSLVTHIRTHTGEKPYVCDQCGKRFVRQSNLASHIRIHTGEKPYVCEACSKRFAHHNNLVNHIRIHTGEKPYVCNTCDKRFSSPSALKVHKRIHSDERKYICEICKKGFNYHRTLISHIRTHTGEKPHYCNQCSRKFSDRQSLIDHIRKHTGEKPYVCDYCSKSFIRQRQLVSHILVHTGETPFVCKLCGQGFRLKSHLTTHISTHSV